MDFKNSSNAESPPEISCMESVSDNRVFLVYRAIAPNGKVYVGITSNTLDHRKYGHYATARRENKTYFHKALLKYGQELKWEVVESGVVGLESAYERERFYINLYKSNQSEFGYNGNAGGVGATLAQISKTKEVSGRPVFRSDGKVFTTASEAALYMGAKRADFVSKSIRRGGTCAGYTFRELPREEFDSLRDQVQIVTGPVEEVHWTLARSFSEEVRSKISNTKKGKPANRSEEGERARVAAISKKVYRSDGAIYNSITEAGESVSKNRDALSHALEKELVVGGYLFSFEKIGPEDLARVLKNLEDQKNRRKSEAMITSRSRSVYCSDGRVFPSFTAAFKALGVKNSTLNSAIKNGTRINGSLFDYSPITPEREVEIEASKEKQKQDALAAIKTRNLKKILRSDGAIFQTFADAAKALGGDRKQLSQAVKNQIPYKDFTFTLIINASPKGKEE